MSFGKEQEFQSYTGKGIVGVVDGKRVALGNLKLFEELKISTEGLRERAEQLRAKAKRSCSWRSKNSWLVSSASRIRSSHRPAKRFRQLHKVGVRIVMLTGDSKATADAMARSLGIDEVHAEVLPSQKAEIIKQLQSTGRIVAMVGAGSGSRGHRNGHRNGYRHRKRRGDTGEGRFARYRYGPSAQPCHHAQYPAEPFLRVFLQPSRRAGGGRRLVSVLLYSRTPLGISL